MLQNNLNRVHFIGVAGSGMAAVAMVAHSQGIAVSGSDLKPSRYVQALLDAHVPVSFGHNPELLDDPTIELVVVSTAIPANNPELLAARARGIEVWHRAQMLAWLSRDSQLLAVTGTHGKTTTSSLLACALQELKAKPTFVVGGVVCAMESSAGFGSGNYFVVEADESDSSFTWFDPQLAIVTNIEPDHLDHFRDLEEVQAAFRAFLAKLRPGGVAIVCADDQALVALTREVIKAPCTILTYGLSEHANLRLVPNLESNSFSVLFPDGQSYALKLPVSPGIHNMLNATAVMAALDWLGFARQDAARAIATFSGVHRRFDIIGTVAGITVIDDYGHHPTEVAATIAAAWQFGFKQVHVLFQPHRFTRTQAFINEFSSAFDGATTLVLMPIYTAGESPIAGISSDALLDAIKHHNPQLNAQLVTQRTELPALMASFAQDGDCVICMGAGDITEEAPKLVAWLSEQHAARARASDNSMPSSGDESAPNNNDANGRGA
jgi:UDP-N-acetylmuramate--alanine ligase